MIKAVYIKKHVNIERNSVSLSSPTNEKSSLVLPMAWAEYMIQGHGITLIQMMVQFTKQ